MLPSVYSALVFAVFHQLHSAGVRPSENFRGFQRNEMQQIPEFQGWTMGLNCSFRYHNLKVLTPFSHSDKIKVSNGIKT